LALTFGAMITGTHTNFSPDRAAGSRIEYISEDFTKKITIAFVIHVAFECTLTLRAFPIADDAITYVVRVALILKATDVIDNIRQPVG
jgi:hypothetical protein